jgi:outer membrane protein assembly factor BamB
MRRRSLLAAFAATLIITTLAVAGALAAQYERAQRAAAPLLTDWPLFGLTAQRANATDLPTGISASDVSHLRRRTVHLPGTVDSSPIYLHAVRVGGAVHDVVFVTTTYGITLAIDAASGRTLWRFTPPGISALSGTAQITTATPAADPNRAYVYATSPNGEVHKLAVADGREARGWPIRITVRPDREKLTAALNIIGSLLLASTGGYFGDATPYVGHLVAIDRANGRISAVFNALCANRRSVIAPASCRSSDAAILSRSGPVVEAGGRAVLIATGNGPYNGTTDFGDSLIELTLPGLRLRQVYTPTDQAQLNADDTDLGSGSPALLPGHLVLLGGKDSQLRLVDLRALDGSAPGSAPKTGGELALVSDPGSAQLFSTPAVWHGLVFVADGGGTGAYRVAGRRLHAVWSNGSHGTSPIIAGGLLWVYDMDAGTLDVYQPSSGRRVGRLSAAPGHWNSPIVVDRRVILPVGDANDQRTSGTLYIYSR